MWKRTEGVYGIRVNASLGSFGGAGTDIAPGFDRDLSIAGRAMVEDDDGNYIHKLIRIDLPSITVAST